MTDGLSLSLRLSCFYAAMFAVIGVQLPFWPLFLAGKGMSPVEIGQIMAGSYFVKIITNPLIGHGVDRRGDRRRPMLALAIASVAASALFSVASGFVPLLAVTLLSQAAFTALMPLGDSLTMLAAATRGLDYGRIRLWGSLSFIAIAGLGGLMLVDAPRQAILGGILAAQALTLAAVAGLPDLRLQRAVRPPSPLRPLLTARPFLLFLAAGSLTQVSHMIYYGFATLHWRAAGLSGGLIGALWAEGVIAEVVLFAFGARLLRRFGPARLLAAGGLAGVVRWTVLGLTTAPAILVSVQFLHAFTFGAAHLGAMHFISRAAPRDLSARAQGIYSAIAMGIVPGCALLAAGTLYQRFGGGAFLAMSLLAAGGMAAALRLVRSWNGGLVAEGQTEGSPLP